MPTKRGHSKAQNLGTFALKCWGYAKRVYRMFPESSSEEDLERNMLEALESVPLASMHRFAVQSSRLDGADAAWANKKYRGHRALPPRFQEDLRQRKSRR
ncbi:hypothetical protein B0H14DRAFT_2785772 [Mycena olivaceomarginata]|nr:hypothetical protein B0H14DRAFT_2785772 [Mycena olivaceomarginata]